MEEKDECVICLSELVDLCTLLPCGHAFNKACLQTWFSKSIRCPICRQAAVSISVDTPGAYPWKGNGHFVICKTLLLPDEILGLSLVDTEEGGFFVEGITESGAMHRAGVKVKDVLLSVNNICFNNIKTLVEFVAAAERYAKESGGLEVSALCIRPRRRPLLCCITHR